MANFSDYMIQHILYIKGVEKSIKHNTVFAHKKPTECAFGKMFYQDIKPNIDGYSEAKRDLIEAMEQIHIKFHDSAQHIHPEDPNMEQSKQDAWYYSSRLINMLEKLEKMKD